MAALLAASCTANVLAPTARAAGAGGAGNGASGARRRDRGRHGRLHHRDSAVSTYRTPARAATPVPTEDANCGLQNFALDCRPALVLLLQDRSTSMRNTLSSGLTRWATP